MSNQKPPTQEELEEWEELLRIAPKAGLGYRLVMILIAEAHRAARMREALSRIKGYTSTAKSGAWFMVKQIIDDALSESEASE